MRKCILYSVLVILIFCFSSCGSKSSDTSEQYSPHKEVTTSAISDAETFGSSVSTIVSATDTFRKNSTSEQKNSIALSAIKDVVQNKKKYFCAVYGRDIYLKDFHSSSYLYNYESNEYIEDDENNTSHVYSRFCVFDIDGDGNPEVLSESETTMGNILVFHYKDGIVYGYVFPFRGMKIIKKDGSFESSGSAAVTAIGKIQFSKDKVIYNELCIVDGLDNIYRINGKDVSQAKTEAYMITQVKKENIEWYPFSEANFEKYFAS